MKTLPALFASLALLVAFAPARTRSSDPSAPARAQHAEFATVRDRALAFEIRGSYELALRAWREATALDLAPEERRLVDFKLADTAWRSADLSDSADTSVFEASEKEFARLQRAVERPEQRDELWADTEEALGDFHGARRSSRNFYAALPHYQAALDWWAGARDVERARRRYLDIVWRMATPEPEAWRNGYINGQVPVELLQNAVRIASTTDERARAELLYGMSARWRGGAWPEVQRGFDALERAVELGRGTPWYDDALFALAQWYEQSGRPEVDEVGGWNVAPDFVRALALYRKYTAEFAKGDAPRHDEARAAIDRILAADVGVSVESAFLPGSVIRYAVHGRNAARVDLALYAVDLTRDVDFNARGTRTAEERSASDWLATIALARVEPRLRWTHETRDDGRHRPFSAELTLEEALPPGAYVIEATAAGKSARDLVLVSSTSLVVKAAADRALVWCCDALTSAPVAGAQVRAWERTYDGSRWRWRTETLTTADDGTALLALSRRQDRAELFVAVVQGERTTFSLGWGAFVPRSDAAWKVYAYTDRSAYRPGDVVQWKITARRTVDGRYATPANESLEYEIQDQRGASVKKGELALNSFGSAWSELPTNDGQALGEYRVSFYSTVRGSRTAVGGATLFRLEEYKLPEFEVTIATPETDGKKKLFRTGERVEAAVHARYYSGGPVADAAVEAIVYQRPHWRVWSEPREYAWLDSSGGDELRVRDYGGPGTIVQRATLRTDAQGRAIVAFDTPENSGGQEFEYTIEARVVDASRREVAGRGRLVVAERAYDVRARAAHKLHRPGDSIELTFEARDANGDPVEAEGRVEIAKERWVEIWIDPFGVERSEQELDEARARSVSEGARDADLATAGWRPKFRGYRREVLEVATLKTDREGRATAKFAAATEGFYTATWTSRDDRKRAIQAQVGVWVANEDTRDTGYRTSGIELVLDGESFRMGQTAPVLVTSRWSNRWVLVTVEGERLHSHRVIHVEGNVALWRIPIGEEHVPNVFLSAWTAHGGIPYADEAAVAVPPVDQFLSVEVRPDRDELLPGGEATLGVVTRDAHGEPIAAEVGLSLVDEAVSAIQSEYAPDPRAFFYGEQRAHAVQTASSLDRKRFAKYVRGEDGELREEERVGNKEDGGGGLRERKDGPRDELAKREGVANGAMSDMKQKASRAASPAAAMEMDASSGDDAGSVVVRSDFRATALWKPDLVTDSTGRASVKVKLPESLTRWKAVARAATNDARFGIAAATVRTNKPLMARLQGPRFFTVGDEAVVSGVIDNRGDRMESVRCSLAVEGLGLAAGRDVDVEVPAGGQRRVDWTLRASEAGRARLVLTARSSAHSDAMERVLPVQAHGIQSLVARALRLADRELACTLDVPAARKRETTRFEVTIAPSLAVTMLDALPYLVDYPYGCTEQTLSRFVPAAIVAKTLAERGISREDAMQRVYGGIEPEYAGATHPNGKRSLELLDDMIARGLARLADFQHADGGWGWWKEGESDHYMTAYVVWSLALARDAEVTVDPAMLDRGARFLALEIVEEEDAPDLAAWMLHALASTSREAAKEPHVRAAFDDLWSKKDRLASYGRALFALAAKRMGRVDEAKLLIENLANGVRVDEAPDASRIGGSTSAHDSRTLATAHWGEDRSWWRTWDGAVESTAFALAAMCAVDPKHELVLPAMNWLVQNRRGAQWSNTRDTAISVLALNAFLQASGETARDVAYELLVNGERVAKVELAARDLLRAPSVYTIAPERVKDGANEIVLRRTRGDGALYLSARAEFFSLEEPIPARGNQVYASRRYEELAGRATLLKGYVYDRLAVADLARIASGERVDVVLTVEAKNDLEYVVFEDHKPAGLEAVELTSGGFAVARELKSNAVERLDGAPEPDDPARYTGRQQGVHQELRDRKVALFLDRLPQGVWEIRYSLRAETPGRFHALPVVGHAMYAPEIRCNGSELRLSVDEARAQDD